MLNKIVIILAVAPAALFLLKALRSKEEPFYVNFAALGAAEILFLVLPELWFCGNNSHMYPSRFGLYNFCFLLFIDSILFFIGYNAGIKKKILSEPVQYKKNILVFNAFLFSLASLLGFFYVQNTLEDESFSRSVGLGVFLTFLSTTGYFALYLGFLLWYRLRSKIAIPILLLQLFLLLEACFRLRRTSIFLFGFFAISALYIFRRIKIPMSILLPSGVLVFLLIYYTPNIRKYFDDPTYTDVRWEMAQQNFFNEKATMASDIPNGIFACEAACNEIIIDGGIIPLYNRFVFYWIPNFILGSGFKQKIMIDYPTPRQAAPSVGWEFSSGSCNTGIADAFFAFSYLGCLLFAALGYIGGRVCRGALIEQREDYMIWYWVLGASYARWFGVGIWVPLPQLLLAAVIIWSMSLFTTQSNTPVESINNGKN